MQFPRLRRPLSPPADARQATRRPALIGAAALGLVLAATPFLPRDESPEPAITPTGDQAAITPEAQAEIDRVVAAGITLSPRQARGTATTAGRTTLARQLTRCATFSGERYCLGVGWTTRAPDEVAASLARTPTRPGRETTGDLDPLVALTRTARLSVADRRAADRDELTRAASAVGKVLRLRRDLDARGTTYPQRSVMLNAKRTRSQNRTYWCGPATLQMIAWGAGNKKNQGFWSRRLNTTTAGTSITEMVRVVNDFTPYDDKDRAGTYIVLDIGDYGFDKWYRLMMRHIHDYRAPVVLHPVLEKRFYPYLDDDASGHFQVGRGYDQNPGGNPRLSFFEPWDQSRFDPSEPFIERVQWRSAYRSFRANKAHFQHNVGV
jgi:hypothetical protein